MEPTISSYVEIRNNRDGQPRAYVAGTRVRVQDIYALVELHGKRPDHVVSAYPHLSLAQVHGALAYYFDHMKEIKEEIRQDEDFVKRFRELSGSGPLEQKLKGFDADAEPVSS